MKIRLFNNKIAAIFILILLISIIGVRYYLKTNETKAENTVKPRPVKVIEIKEETYPITLDYIGTIGKPCRSGCK